MNKNMGIMAAGFNFSAVNEEEFHDWYDSEHIPERLNVEGFVNAERWIGADDPKIAFATYDLKTVDVLQHPDYLAFTGKNQSLRSKTIEGQVHKIGRFVGEQILPGQEQAPKNAGGLLFVAMNVEAEYENEFNDWYNLEHIPRLAKVPGCLSARRFIMQGGTHKYIAIYHLETVEISASPVWKKAVQTPWTKRIIAHTSVHLRIPMRKYIKK